VSFYTGNLHKWCCAPKGTAIPLGRGADRIGQIHPLVVSHWYGDGFSAEFHWQGTRDHAGWLSAGSALDFLGQFGWEERPRPQPRQGNRRPRNAVRALWRRTRFTAGWLAARLHGHSSTAAAAGWIERGADEGVAAIALHGSSDGSASGVLGGKRFLRVSCQIYNGAEEYERVAEVVREIAATCPYTAFQAVRDPQTHLARLGKPCYGRSAHEPPILLQRLLASDRTWTSRSSAAGATGVGIAVDAASRGYSVCLLEQSDFGKGTSSRSTKLIHGGVRYLQQGNISLVMEALKERGILRQNAPHPVHDLSSSFPNYVWWEAPF